MQNPENQIEKVRKEINDHFNPETFVKGENTIVESPCKKYSLKTCEYYEDKEDSHWRLTKVEIFENSSGEKLFNFFGNDDRFFFEWLYKEQTDYFFCAEDLFGGQTVIDLTNRKMTGYSPDEDGFISADIHLSPDGKLLVIIGCYWACPYIIKVFDFSEPLSLPLKELAEIELIDNTELIKEWVDNTTIKTDQRIIDLNSFLGHE